MLKRLTDQRSSSLLTLLLGVMIAVLLVLGFLQYRWISEAGDAAERQLRENLDVSVKGFAQEFQEQLQRLGAEFRRPRSPDSTDHDVIEEFRKDQASWSATAAFPELLENAFLVKANEDGKPTLLHFDVQGDQLQSVEWPSDLAPLTQKFRSGFNGLPGPESVFADI